MERLLLIDDRQAAAEDVRRYVTGMTKVLQYLGPRLLVVEASSPALAELSAHPGIQGVYEGALVDFDDPVIRTLSSGEQMGLQAWNLRHAEDYLDEKRHRPRDGESWSDSDGKI
jgi:hypothetical protein